METEQYSAFEFEAEITAEEKTRIQTDVKKLSVLNPFRSSFTIFLNWIVIFSTVFIAYKIANPFSTVLVVLIIGARQHALLLLMHDGAHYRLSGNKKINQIISDFLCAYPLFVTTSKYRDSHLAHHKYLNTELDPDWMLRKGLDEWEFPKSKRYIFLLLLRQLNPLIILGKIYRFGTKNKTTPKQATISLTYKIARIAYYLLIIAVLSYFHKWQVYLLYWVLPAFTVLPVLLRIRSLAEHFGLPWSHELNSARNVMTNWFERFFLIQHSANYHLDHHLYPSVPFYNLKRLHKVLLKNPVYASKAVNSDGYLKANKDSVISALESSTLS